MLQIFRQHFQSLWLFYLVLSVGLAVRIFALAHIAIINPDGILYINQAKAIFNGQWHLLGQCQLTYVSLYPFLVALVHHAIPDWILAGQFVSLLFGMGMLLVLYHLLLVFFDRIISGLTTLLLALTPVFVRYSVDVMRDALFWFFFSLALWLFILHIRQKSGSTHSYSLLISSGIVILIASWSRIEAFVLLPVSFLFLCVYRCGDKFKRLLIFIAPFACVALAGVGLALASDRDVFALVRVDEVIRKFSEPFTAYRLLRGDLKVLADGYGFSLMGNYLQSSYHTIWATVFGGIVANAAEAFFYPYILFYVVGTKELIRRARGVPEFQYIFMVIICSTIVLVVHFLQTWVMTYRFISMLIIPSCVIAGLGIKNMLDFFSHNYKFGVNKFIFIILLFLLFSTLGKNFKKFESDKDLYVDIGRMINSLMITEDPVKIASKRSVVSSWIAFYTNVKLNNIYSCHPFVVDQNSLNEMVAVMRMNGISLLLWEEFAWKKSQFGSKSIDFIDDFDLLYRFWHDDTGELLLFRLK